jgi:hypothetical protein
MHKRALNRFLAASGIVILGFAMAPAVYAQAQRPGYLDYWAGRSKGPTATCPTLEWDVVPLPHDAAGKLVGNAINGVAYYGDMSGVSTIKGTISADGNLTATLTSVSGAGPTGTVTGMRGAKGTHIELHGAGCANATFDLPRWQATAATDGSGG